ncbi:MAG: twin-arginine translocase subunit TatC [Deferrisomatales bacterium]
MADEVGETGEGAGSGGGGEAQPLVAHLEELRSRLIKSGVAVLGAMIACYSVSEEVFAFLLRPVVAALPEGSHLAMLRVQEGFVTHLRVSLFAGIVAAAPVILYQAWKFVAPGLYPHEKRHVWPFVAAGTFFFLVGGSFAYWVVFPFAFRFLLGYGTGSVQAVLSIGEYLDFSTRLLLAFGLVFETPVVAFFLGKIGVLTWRPLARNRGYALIAVAVISAVLTPTPDVFNQLLMGVPLYLLFELSILVLRWFGPEPDPDPDPDPETEPAEGG